MRLSCTFICDLWTQYCLACQWTTTLCINCRSIWKQVMQGSRPILPTGLTFATNFLSWSHEHIILWHFFFLMQHLINQCMLMKLHHSLLVYVYKSVKNSTRSFLSVLFVFFKFCEQEFLFLCTLTFTFAIWCHVLQKKIIVCFAYIYTFHF